MTTLFSILLSSTVNFIKKIRDIEFLINKQPIAFCDFYSQSLEIGYSFSWSASLNLTHALACRIRISSPLRGALSQHFPCPLPILLDSSHEQAGLSQDTKDSQGLETSTALLAQIVSSNVVTLLFLLCIRRIPCSKNYLLIRCIGYLFYYPVRYMIYGDSAQDLLSHLMKQMKEWWQNASDIEFLKGSSVVFYYYYCYYYPLNCISSKVKKHKVCTLRMIRDQS